MTGGCGPELIDGIGSGGQSRIKAKSIVSAYQVIVNRLGNANNRQSSLLEFVTNAEGAIPANGNDGVDPIFPAKVKGLGCDVGISQLIGMLFGKDKVAPVGCP